jgi:hypothetical protein
MGGRVEEGIKEQETAFANGMIAGGGSIAQLVDAYLRAEKTSRGLLAVERGLRFSREREQGGWEPDLHRLRGELLLQRANARGGLHLDDIDSAGRCFLNAIERARENDAKSFELRAAMSLCRLQSKQSRGKEGRQILSEVYRSFTEGFATADLVDARKALRAHRIDSK